MLFSQCHLDLFYTALVQHYIRNSQSVHFLIYKGAATTLLPKPYIRTLVVKKMPYATDKTAWPSTGLTSKTKGIISLLFQLVDLNDPKSGEKLATEVFTDDGKFLATSGNFTGKGMALLESV